MTAEPVVSRLGHVQVRIEGYGQTAVVDEGIAADVKKLWRRRITTFASCEGSDPELLGGGRYIGCRKSLDVRRAQDIAESLGWVDHVVWSTGQTCFYEANRFPCRLFRIDGILMLPRVAPQHRGPSEPRKLTRLPTADRPGGKIVAQHDPREWKNLGDGRWLSPTGRLYREDSAAVRGVKRRLAEFL